MNSGRAVVYVRVSTAEQVKNSSLASQEEACRKYCGNHKLVVDRVFIEDGASAKTAVRDELQSLLAYCAKNAKTLDYVIVWRVDRLARRAYDHHTIRAALAQFGIALRSVEEPFDDTATGRFLENMMAAIAQLDNDVRSDRTSRGMKHALGQGRWQWKAPLGYIKPKSGESTASIIPDPENAPLVRYAFEQLAGGSRTKQDVLDEVSALGLNRNGRPLAAQSFSNLLRNPIYKGKVVSKGFDFEGPGDFEPLVDEQTFDAVQLIGYNRSQATPRRLKNHPDFPLRSFLRCEQCGHLLTASWSSGRSDRYGYYRCYRKDCGKVKDRRERVHEAFLDMLRNLSAERDVQGSLAEIVRDVWQEMRRQSSTRSDAIRSRIEAIEGKQRQLMEAHVYAHSIDAETYEGERLRLEGLKATLQKSMPVDDISEDRLEAALQFADQLLENLNGYWNQLAPQQRPAFLRAVFPGGLSYGASGIGTGYNPWLFNETSLPDQRREALVAPMGFEPTLPP
jgi:site-specific DNA recombinase